MGNPKLVKYAKEFFRITCRPGEAVAVTIEQVAEFAALLREGCMQDLQHLLLQAIDDTPDDTPPKEALRIFGSALIDGGTELWGLNDCGCNKARCVYCGPRIARRVVGAMM